MRVLAAEDRVDADHVALPLQSLQVALGASQQNISKHPSILHNAGMVTHTKDGNHARYSIADEAVFELCEQVCGGLGRQLDELDALLAPGPAK